MGMEYKCAGESGRGRGRVRYSTVRHTVPYCTVLCWTVWCKEKVLWVGAGRGAREEADDGGWQAAGRR